MPRLQEIAVHTSHIAKISSLRRASLGAVCPPNYIGFEYALGQPDWWYDIVEGLPHPIVKDGYIDVWDKPGLGITFNVAAAKPHLAEDDRTFFD